jgi:zinc transporter 7
METKIKQCIFLTNAQGFTAGGFIYIAMVGVLPEMHHKGTSFKITLLQLISLMSGMGVALWISLIE